MATYVIPRVNFYLKTIWSYTLRNNTVIAVFFVKWKNDYFSIFFPNCKKKKTGRLKFYFPEILLMMV